MTCKAKCSETRMLGANGRLMMVAREAGGKFKAGVTHEMCDDCLEELLNIADDRADRRPGRGYQTAVTRPNLSPKYTTRPTPGKLTVKGGRIVVDPDVPTIEDLEAETIRIKRKLRETLGYGY